MRTMHLERQVEKEKRGNKTLGETDIVGKETFQRCLGPWQSMCGSGREGASMSMIEINRRMSNG